MRDATADRTVTPLLYEERKPVLDINEAAIDNWFDKITLGLSDQAEERFEGEIRQERPGLWVGEPH